MSTARRARRQRERDEPILMRLAMGWPTRMGKDRTLTQRERRVLRRNGKRVEHPYSDEVIRRTFRRLQKLDGEAKLPTRVVHWKPKNN